MTDNAATEDLTAIETVSTVFRRARAWVAGSPFLAVIEQDMTLQTGRPRVIGWEQMLTMLALTAIHGKGTLVLMDVARVASGLSPSQRFDLDLAAGALEYSHVESALADLKAAVAPTVNKETGGVLKDPRLTVPCDDLCNMIIRATVPDCVKEPTDQAIDSTDYKTSAARRSTSSDGAADVPKGSLPEKVPKPTRPPKNKPGYPKIGSDGRFQHSADPDARDGYCSAKELEPKGVFLGYNLHLTTDVTPRGDGRGRPAIIRGMVLARAGSYKGDAGLALIDSVRRIGSPLRKVLVDRGYTYLVKQRWAAPLWERGIEQVLDLHTNQRVTHPGPLPGTVFVDGGLFIEDLPGTLRSLPNYPRGQNAVDAALLAARYDQRAAYAFTPFGGRNAERRSQRYRGPAITSRVRCPNTPRSMRLDPGIRPTTSCVPGQDCPCGKTVTLGADDELRTRQDHLFGTRKWLADYHRRNNVESANAALKRHASKLARASTRVFGLTKNSILLAFIIGATNIAVLLSRYAVDIAASPPGDRPVLPKPAKKDFTSHHYKVFGKTFEAEQRAGAKQRGDPDSPGSESPDEQASDS